MTKIHFVSAARCNSIWQKTWSPSIQTTGTISSEKPILTNSSTACMIKAESAPDEKAGDRGGKITINKIYEIFAYFDKMHAMIANAEKGDPMNALFSEIQVHPKPNGQWRKSIKFKLPIIKGDLHLIWISHPNLMMLFFKA